MRALRFIRWGAVAGVVLLLAAMAAFEFAPGMRDLVLSHSGGTASASGDETVNVPAGVPIGGAFELTDDKRHAVTDADYRGRWMLDRRRNVRGDRHCLAIPFPPDGA